MNVFMCGVLVQVYVGVVNVGVVFVGCKDSGICNVKGFVGKKVVVFMCGLIQDISLCYLLYENGLKVSDEGGNVIIVLIDLVNMFVVFVGKQVDVVLVQEFWGVIMEGQGVKFIVNEKGVWNGGNYIFIVFVVNIKYVVVNLEIVKDLLCGYFVVINLINKSNVGVQKVILDQIYVFIGKCFNSVELFKVLVCIKVIWDINL